jgi:hypothetical protein
VDDGFAIKLALAFKVPVQGSSRQLTAFGYLIDGVRLRRLTVEAVRNAINAEITLEAYQRRAG